MPGGISIGWDNNAPTPTDPAGSGDDEIRSLKTNLQGALNSEHNWPAAGGAAVGYHRYGSARPYLGPRSQVSSDGTDARLMVDTANLGLWYLGASGAATPIGGRSIPLNYNTSDGIYNATAPAANVVQYGVAVTGSGGSVLVTYAGSGFSGIPVTFLTHGVAATSLQTVAGILKVLAPTSSGFTAFCQGFSGLPVSAQTVFWLSLGTASAGV